MRLFLASAGVRGRVHELTELVGAGARVAVSANALDLVVSEAERAVWLDRELAALAGAGLVPRELDLRVADTDGLADADMLWATGGNAFVLRKALRRSGIDDVLLARLRDGSLAYGGSSAGACICGPTLRGIELIDDASADGEPLFTGLGLVDFCIAPHFEAEGEAGETIARLVEHYQLTGTPYRALRDGQAIVVRDGAETLIDCYRDDA
ncbi:MAG TPA: Type 1 glutamine amidotransferase-like domain-containing protein [Gaiellaceae bacterium]|nr:Type 1 glutamine amidotransferase-like domain-containing protein [Gaiellaceae bacterium]